MIERCRIERFLILSFFICLLVTIGSQPSQAQTNSNQVWPEIDLFIKVKPKIRLFFMGTTSKGIDDGENSGLSTFEAQFGASIDYLPNKHIVLRTGYRFGTSIGDTDDPYKEHRLLTEQTFRKGLPKGLLVSDRNREDFRFISGDFSFRYRNRVTIEREFTIKKRSITPYTSGEIFYDTRYDIWNRNRVTAGVQVSLRNASVLKSLVSGREIILDTSYARQLDSRSSTPRVDAVGVTLAFYF